MIKLKKNGFTLTELLAVIVIIGAVLVLVVPAVLGSGENARNKISEIEEKNLTEASKMLAIDIDNPVTDIYNCDKWVSSYCTKNNSKWEKIEITVGVLIDHGYFTDNDGHLDRNISLVINSDYTVNINQ